MFHCCVYVSQIEETVMTEELENITQGYSCYTRIGLLSDLFSSSVPYRCFKSTCRLIIPFYVTFFFSVYSKRQSTATFIWP